MCVVVVTNVFKKSDRAEQPWKRLIPTGKNVNFPVPNLCFKKWPAMGRSQFAELGIKNSPTLGKAEKKGFSQPINKMHYYVLNGI